jgi:glycosyltransferase involved in cell wall biosynthesis
MDTRRAVIFFDFSGAYLGGSSRTAIDLFRRLRDRLSVVVFDGTPTATEAQDRTRTAGLELHLLPEHLGDTRLATAQRLRDRLRVFLRLIRVAIHLRILVRRIKPSALIVTSEKALAIACIAVPRRPRVVFYLLGEIRRTTWSRRLAWRRVDSVVAVSKACLHGLARLQISCHQTSVAYTSVQPVSIGRHGAAMGAVEVDTSALTMLVPASVVPIKNHRVAVEAVALALRRGTRVQLLLAGGTDYPGNQDYVADLHRLVGHLALESAVQFLGYRNDIPALMGVADAVCLSSDSEGLPRALLEAMACGLPCVATAVGGIPELITDGLNGLLVPPGDADALADAMCRLSDPSVRQGLGRAARCTIEERFSSRAEEAAFLAALASAVVN